MRVSIDAKEVVDSLHPGDGVIRRWPVIYGLLGCCLLVIASMKRPKMPPLSKIMVLISNPVAHGAVQAEIIMSAIPEPRYSVVADSTHSSLTTDAQVNFPTTSPKSLIAFGVGSALIKALRIRMKVDLSTVSELSGSRVYKEYLVLAQCVRYVLAEQIWSMNPQVKLVVTDFDRHIYVRPLLDIARNNGISTVTTFHGSPSENTYLPIRAETAFAWGNVQEQWLAKVAPETHVCVIGRPVFSRKTYTNSAAPRLIVLNSLEILSTHEADKLVSLIAAHKAKNHQTLVRLHPKCRTRDIQQPTWGRVLDAVDDVVHTDGDLSLFLSQDDVVSGVVSTGMIDALMLNVQVVGAADILRTLPVDLRYILNHEHVDARQVRESVVRATGDEFIANARAALALILAE